ncbi:hypothetical protein [Halopelagius fulvigenes]|uniref:Uncharacterized protein n=1 Tax=Halopelagius fulvigenes TaxID=1198324 RepID=A0ABD5U7K2_9EURY
MSTSSAEYEKSVNRDGSDSEEPPNRVLYGAPQHETDVPQDPYREMLDVEEDDSPLERDLFTLFEHFSVDPDEGEDDHSSTVGVGPIAGIQTA